jgi:hypothetical protein
VAVDHYVDGGLVVGSGNLGARSRPASGGINGVGHDMKVPVCRRLVWKSGRRISAGIAREVVANLNLPS